MGCCSSKSIKNVIEPGDGRDVKNNRVPLVPTAPRDYHIQAPEINQNERVVAYQATNPAPLTCIINYCEPKSKFRAIYCSNGHLVCKQCVPYYLFKYHL